MQDQREQVVAAICERALDATPAADAFRLLGMVDSAADSRGEVTRPRYPVVDADEAVAFHRERLEAVLERFG